MLRFIQEIAKQVSDLLNPDDDYPDPPQLDMQGNPQQRQQKNVVRPESLFIKTGSNHLSGNSKPAITHKQSKISRDKEFALKHCGTEVKAINEKLCYDLLQLCGVRVPKSYLVKDEHGSVIKLATRMEPGYKDLLFFFGGLLKKKNYRYAFDVNHEIAGRTGSTQTVAGEFTKSGNDKPIRGLFEHLAVFVFLLDRDAVGPSFQNMGLIEYADYCQMVKIDPGMCSITKDTYVTFEYETMLQNMLNRGADHIDCFNNKSESEIFRHATQEQIIDGMRRVANLTDAQLRKVIFNDKIPDPKGNKDSIFKLLTERRDAFRSCLIKSNIEFDEAAMLQENTKDHVAELMARLRH